MTQTSVHNKIRAVLFDLDGTLIDTEDQYTAIWGKIGKKYHPELPDFAHRIKGMTLQRILDAYFPDEETRKVVVPELYEHEGRMVFTFYPGALAFISDLRRCGVKCAVVTSSNRKKMETLRRQIADFDGLFDAILTAEDFRASKPDPDCFLTAAAKLSCQKEECVVFEDAPNGLEAGRRSGMFTVGVQTTLTREQITPLCDYVLQSYEGFTLAELERITEKSPESDGKE